MFMDVLRQEQIRRFFDTAQTAAMWTTDKMKFKFLQQALTN